MVKQSCSFGELNVPRADARHLIGFLRCAPHRGEGRDVLLLVERHEVRRLRDAQNAHGLIGEIARAIERHAAERPPRRR